MNSFKDQLSELVQLTELYLLQEYSPNDKVSTSFENFTFFKQQAAALKKSRAEPSLTQASPVKPLEIIPPRPTPPKIQPKAIPKEEAVPSEPAKKMEPIQESDLKPEPITPAKARDFSDLRKIMQEQAPGIKIIETPLPTKKTPPPEVLVFYTMTISLLPAHQELLQQLVKAIGTHLFPARLVDVTPIESGIGWSHYFSTHAPKLLLISQNDLKSLPLLEAYLKSSPINIPQVIMPTADEMMKDPAAKRTLWNTLKSFFSKT